MCSSSSCTGTTRSNIFAGDVTRSNIFAGEFIVNDYNKRTNCNKEKM